MTPLAEKIRDAQIRHIAGTGKILQIPCTVKGRVGEGNVGLTHDRSQPDAWQVIVEFASKVPCALYTISAEMAESLKGARNRLIDVKGYDLGSDFPNRNAFLVKDFSVIR